MQYIKINETLYPILSVEGRICDRSWDSRAVKVIILEMDYIQAASLFVDGLVWSVVNEATDTDGNTVQNVYDYSAYSKAGEITDHRNGLLTVKMGMPTALEQAVTNAEASAAYKEGVNKA